MSNNSNSKNRKVSKKDILTAFAIVFVGCVVLYFRETGELWAKILLAVLMVAPIVGFLFYYFKMSEKDKREFNIRSNEALNSRPYKMFTRGIYIFVGALVLIAIFLNK